MSHYVLWKNIKNVYYENKRVWWNDFCNMSCDSNDNELKLTKEYKYLLSYIRPLVDQLEKSKDAQLCLLWLSKLEQCSSWERNYRNKILLELCKQVKSNSLKPPFNVAPPNGPLRNIFSGVHTDFFKQQNLDWKARDWSNQCSEVDVSTEEVISTSSHQSYIPKKNLPRRQIPGLCKGNYFLSNLRSKNTKAGQEPVDHSECFAIQKAYHEKAQSDQMVIEKYQDIIKSLVSQQLKADISPNRLKKLQSTYEIKLAEVVHVLKRTQEENEMLKRKIENLSGCSDNLDSLKNDNESLRKKILELENEINAFEKKCKEIEEEKSLSLAELTSRLNESEKKIKESEKRYKNLEKKYEDTCRNFESEFKAKVSEKEKIHLCELTTLENVVQEKQVEISRLKEEINNQKAGFQQEISCLKQQLEEKFNFGKDKEKIRNLKTKAKKLEKMREHMAVLFQSQLQHILAKKDFYIASLEMQLKVNNSESGGSTFCSDFHNSLNQKISDLEAQYRKLLEDSEQQSIKRRQLDLQKIHSLEKQLLSLGGGVVVKEPELNLIKATSVTSDSAFVFNSTVGEQLIKHHS